MGEVLLDSEFPGTTDGVRSALAAVESALTADGAASGAAPAAELVLAEVLNNVVEHALAEAEQGSRFGLRLSAGPETIAVDVRDRGAPMPGGMAPAGKRPDVNVDLADLPEGGFGWYLIREIAQDLHYARENGENHLAFWLPLAEPAGA
ncbi:MAG: ATP-binding protein [Pseudomonadota bacterium]